MQTLYLNSSGGALKVALGVILCVVYVPVRHVDVMPSGVEALGQTRTSAAHGTSHNVTLSAVEG